MESTTLKRQKCIRKRGFTFVEMLVVLGIITILTTVMMVSQTSFNKGTLLTDTTYTVALSIRESQTLGISGREVSSVAPNAGYGVHFGDSPTYYDQFADSYPAAPGTNAAYCPEHASLSGPDSRPGDCIYENAQNEKVQRYTFSQGYTINRVCYVVGGVSSCFVPGDGSNKAVDIVYERPNTQAVITETVSGVGPTAATQVAVEVTSPQSGTRCVIATQLGEVYVSSTCP